MKGRAADTPVQTDTEKVTYVRLAQKRLNYAGLAGAGVSGSSPLVDCLFYPQIP